VPEPGPLDDAAADDDAAGSGTLVDGARSVDLQTAASMLGVHYQTAYRWVRSGRLEAHLVDGRYRVTEAAIQQLQARRSAPEPVSARPGPGPGRRARAAERMLDALVEGDEAAARKIARRLVAEGSGVIDVIQDTVVPPLVEIGRRWHDGELSIWVEHRASAIVERMLGELAPNPRGRRRGTVAVAALTGDLHALPTSMAAVVLRDDNWNVHHLGANMPPDELHRFCRDHGVDVVVLSSTNPDVAEATHRLADELRAEGTATLVGAPGVTLSDLVGAVRQAAHAG